MEKLQQRIGYHFCDDALLKRALTHPSVAQSENYQRLEFLGDAVVGIIVARVLYDLFPSESEGELARRHAGLVCRDSLATIAREISLGDALHIATSEVQSNGRDNPSNLEDAMEALLGAMYLDGGIEAVETFFAPRIRQLASTLLVAPKDAKTSLQEWSQARGLPVPNYELVETTGPAHAPEFTIEATVQGFAPVTAKANSKRAAEQAAAGMLLEKLSN